MRVLRSWRNEGPKEIEAKACSSYDDILRCRPIVSMLRRHATTERAENSVMAGRAFACGSGAKGSVVDGSVGAAERHYMKKVCVERWKSVIGQLASGKAAWRWAITWIAGRCDAAG
jgi:hypothetical protein